MEKTALKIGDWIKKNKLNFICLVLILSVAAFLRLYKISGYMTFLGDEGRDVILVRRFLVNQDIMLIGPVTSVGNMYLGPLYYYSIAPALWLARFNPVGPAVFVALVGLATVFLTWWVTRKWFSDFAALVAAGLYAVSPTVVILSKSSWNPNVMPFFALISIWALWQVWQEKKDQWLLVLGMSSAFILQSHYLGVLLIFVLLFYWFKIRNKRKTFKKYSFLGLLSFALLMSPLLFFDLRHNWMNVNALIAFLSQAEQGISFNFLNLLLSIWPNFKLIVTRLVGMRNNLIGFGLSLFLLFGFLSSWKKIKNKQRQLALLGIWMLIGILGLGFYNREIYDHYFGFLFPAPFILTAGIAGSLIDQTKKVKYVIFVAVLLLIYFAFSQTPIKYPPNYQLSRTREVARRVQTEAGGKPYNFAVIARRNYEDAYEYFLELWQEPRVDIDPQKADETITDQLFVVCEDPPETCDPTHNAKAEIANFGWSEIEAKWEVGGVILYKLKHVEKTAQGS